MESCIDGFPLMERDCANSLLEIKKVLRASRLFLLLLASISMGVFGEKSSFISICTLCEKKKGQVRTL